MSAHTRSVASLTVSVVIPVYNGARYLAAALDSVLAQTRPPEEVVVVDDGSTDATPAVLAGYGARITVLRQANCGPCVATNRGIAASTGAVLAFLDADDLWLPDKLALQLAALAAPAAPDSRDSPDSPHAPHAPDAVFGHVAQFISPELPPERAARLRCPSEPQPGLCRSTLLLHRAAFERVGGFDETQRVVDFLEWYPKALDAGLHMAMVAQVVARRRIHDSNTGVLRRDQQRADNVDALKRLLDRRRARAAPG